MKGWIEWKNAGLYTNTALPHQDKRERAIRAIEENGVTVFIQLDRISASVMVRLFDNMGAGVMKSFSLMDPNHRASIFDWIADNASNIQALPPLNDDSD
jgi:hypothetical protein